jgi:hypothetical protein
MNMDIRTKMNRTSQTLYLRNANYKVYSHSKMCRACRYGLSCDKLDALQNELDRVLKSVDFSKKQAA